MNVPIIWMTVSAVSLFLNGVAFALLALQERNRALALWSLAWLVWTPVVYLVGSIDPHEHPYVALGGLTLDLVSLLLFIAGSYAIVSRRMPRYWFYVGGGTVVACLIVQVLLGGIAGLIPLIVVHSFGLASGGILIIRANPEQTGAWFGGSCFVLMGVHVLDYPVVAAHPYLMPWGFIVASGLTSGCALGMLMLHYGTTRARLLATQKAMEEGRRSEALGRVAGGVAHDFNNLLTVMQGNIEIARAHPGDQTKETRALDAIDQAILQASRLTSRLLTFGRRAPVRVEGIEMREVIEDMGTLLGRVIPEGIQLSIEISPGMYRGLMDRSLLEQILLNLVTNARDAIGKDGRILVEASVVSSPATALRLQVTDTGEGISEDDAEQIFEPFFTTKASGKGTGLGLASVQGAVSQLGGTIHFNSKKDEGTYFEVLLPFEPTLHLSSETPQKNCSLVLKILVVDDDAQVRNITTRMLENAGHSVQCTSSGEEALTMLRVESYDLLLSDIVMPKMDGVTLVHKARELRPEFPIVLISGYPGDNPLNEAGVEFLPKPFQQKQLLGMVLKAYHRKKKRDGQSRAGRPKNASRL